MRAHRLITLMKHGGQKSQMVISLLYCLEGHQLEIGTFQRFFEADFVDYSHFASDSLLKHTWGLLKYCNLHLETSHQVPVRLRKHDEAIMEKILEYTT